MLTRRLAAAAGWLALGGVLQAAGPAVGPKAPAVFVLPKASGLERFAAREARRYLYLRFGALPRLQTTADPAQAVPETGAVLVGVKSRPEIRALFREPAARLSLMTLEPQQYWIKTLELPAGRLCVLAGGDETGALYAAYRFAHRLGVRFYLHGDVVPDARWKGELPILDERRMPIFGLRGVQPFHDFPEGPDWWGREECLAVVAQLPKLGMNFIGLHTYPEGRPNAEPTVWIGRPEDVNPDGSVKFAYPASYQNTLRGNWGYAARPTSEYSFGAGQLFDQDAYGSEVMSGLCPEPKTPEACKEVFRRAGELLRTVFRYGKELGVKACVGTETPLVAPKAVAQRLQTAGVKADSAQAKRLLYQGIFERITAAYPVDYYWLWTPESWTWQGASQEAVLAALGDIGLAVDAARRIKAPFKLATCGWVLGPPKDPAMFGRVLPPEVAVSCINRQVGMAPVEPAFQQVGDRGKWAIPWLEDDPALTIPQLWVGRMRKDAADARRYGCTGLMGIHWRTRVIAPNLAALAEAAWDQSAWNKTPYLPLSMQPQAGPEGGRVVAFVDHQIADTEDDLVYQTIRYDLKGYRLPVANGKWTVRLQFCEPHYNQAGKRVFNVKVQGKTAAENLDIFGRVGKDRALDLAVSDVTVTNGWLNIEFQPVVEYPSVAGIVVEGPGRPWKINCGGPAYKDYLPDWPDLFSGSRHVRSADFYLDWASAEFGPKVGPKAARILTEMDGRLPRPAQWIHGPGGIAPDPRPWRDVAPEYRFVGFLEALADDVEGAGNRARFGYWLETFRYLRAVARLRCGWAEFNKALDAAKKASAADRPAALNRALAKRIALVKQLAEVYEHLLATVSSTGELGTIANWEQHIRPDLIDKPGAELEKLLGKPLPPEASLSAAYRGPLRIIVPAARTSFQPAEPFSLRILVLAQAVPRSVTVYWRKMGRGLWQTIKAEHVARGVYRARFPMEASRAVLWPETAPAIPHTLVRMPLPEALRR